MLVVVEGIVAEVVVFGMWMWLFVVGVVVSCC